MNRFIFTLFVWVVCLLLPVGAAADIAVVVRITQANVTLERIHRSKDTELSGTNDTLKRRATSLASNGVDSIKRSALSLANGPLVIEWYDASGWLVHQETRRDPRFIHGPGGTPVVLKESVMLLRAPASAARLQIRPRGFVRFVPLELSK